VRPTLRMAGVGLACVAWAAAAPAQEPAPPPVPVMPAPAPKPAAAPAPDPPSRGRSRRVPSRRPIHDSIERVVDAVVASHTQPCDVARQRGVPCFPVSIEQEGPRFSVAGSLRRYRPTSGPTPGVPTNAEIHEQMSGAPLSASGGVGFDPACTLKNLVTRISGGSTTFYLYRMWDEMGARPLLSDHELDPKTYLANPFAQYELLGKFDGECAAVAAWRQAVLKGVERTPLPGEGDEAKRDGPPE
jgi:hypothetical protein